MLLVDQFKSLQKYIFGLFLMLCNSLLSEMEKEALFAPAL
jgi:hypothetical protein